MKKRILLLALFSLCTHLIKAQSKNDFSFNFGTENREDAVKLIDTPVKFSDDHSFGFDFGTTKNVILNKDGFTSTKPVYFSIKVPQGNYKIEITLGSDESSSETTLKAESRRVFCDRIQVNKGESKTETFVVNMRTPVIKDQDSVSLKSRELDDLGWDNRLTIEFSGEVAVKKIKISQDPGVKTLFLAGDSTMTDQDVEPWASWGQVVTQYFSDSISVSNHAFSGASLAAFKGLKRLEKIKEQIRPGDYIVIGFAHNDSKRRGEGIGPWESYTDLLIEFIEVARERGANAILITPAQRRSFNKDGTLKPTHGDYPDAIRKVAKDLDVPLVDITIMTTQMYESWGVETSRKAFVQYPANTFPGQTSKLEDNTHFNSFGANEIALAFIKGLQSTDSTLKNFLITDASSYDPSKPNDSSSWKLPLSPRFDNVKPDGN